MKITKQRLKEIIEEELQIANEQEVGDSLSDEEKIEAVQFLESAIQDMVEEETETLKLALEKVVRLLEKQDSSHKFNGLTFSQSRE